MSVTKAEKERVVDDRRGTYGDPNIMHAAIGKAWAGVLSVHLMTDVPPIPPHIVAMMMASMKINRASGKAIHHDNYLDAAVYLDFAENMHK